ncbi:MAG: transglycosylase domain-containing protein [Rubrobacter sp.]
MRTTFLVFAGLGLLTCVAVFSSFAYSYNAFADDLPELENYQSSELAQTSIVYDFSGEVMSELYGVQNRFVVGLDDVSPNLQDAVVAIEDHRFYEHRGLDFEAIGRAAQRNVETLSIQEGGSTITQQLIKNTYIAQEQRSVASFQRKINEATLAWQYEKENSKDEILEQYLNTVYFGANAYGSEAAARTYFNKPASELNLEESALLAGVINLPGAYDPFNDPESAKARRNVVLNSMLQFGFINQEEHDRAAATEIELSRGRVEARDDNEYFLNAVRRELAREYGDQMIYEGGLKIYTTLDPNLQEQASSAVESVVDPSAGDPSASLVSVEPSTGAVRAMVGGSDFDEVKFNLATQSKRQPGSSFKAFVLAEMVRQGISPESIYDSESLRIPLPADSDEPFYEVSNYGFIERGPITVEEATAQSDNTVFVQLAQDLGMENVVDMAQDLGITSTIEPYLSTAIGGLGEGVSPFEMASAYSTFANSGTHMEPYLVERVTRDENGEEVTLQEHELAGEEVLTRDENAVVAETLQGVVERGTASQFHDLDEEIGRPSAGKTGTTENFADAWYVGFVPQLATSVWVGYPGDRTPMVNIRGYEEINGENFPLDIWSNYMQGAVQFYDVQQFDTPSPSLDLEVEYEGRPVPERETTERTTPSFDAFDFGNGGNDNSAEPGSDDFDGGFDSSPATTTPPTAPATVSPTSPSVAPNSSSNVQPQFFQTGPNGESTPAAPPPTGSPNSSGSAPVQQTLPTFGERRSTSRVKRESRQENDYS